MMKTAVPTGLMATLARRVAAPIASVRQHQTEGCGESQICQEIGTGPCRPKNPRKSDRAPVTMIINTSLSVARRAVLSLLGTLLAGCVNTMAPGSQSEPQS